MRKRICAGLVVVVACGGSGGKSDSVIVRDSGVVAGRPAVPTTTAVTADSASPARATSTSQVPATTRDQPRSSAPAAPGATPPANDSVRGVVSVTGTSFEKHVMVAGAAGRLEITGPLTSLIGHLAGADVSVTGAVTGKQFAATSFVVRSVDNQPAIDGRLREEGSALYIITETGVRTRIVNPPPPLLGKGGNRVWITGDPSKGVESFGFIDPPR